MGLLSLRGGLQRKIKIDAVLPSVKISIIGGKI